MYYDKDNIDAPGMSFFGVQLPADVSVEQVLTDAVYGAPLKFAIEMVMKTRGRKIVEDFVSYWRS